MATFNIFDGSSFPDNVITSSKKIICPQSLFQMRLLKMTKSILLQ